MQALMQVKARTRDTWNELLKQKNESFVFNGMVCVCWIKKNASACGPVILRPGTYRRIISPLENPLVTSRIT